MIRSQTKHRISKRACTQPLSVAGSSQLSTVGQWPVFYQAADGPSVLSIPTTRRKDVPVPSDEKRLINKYSEHSVGFEVSNR